MPSFVILEHRMPVGHERSLHWDVMLEREGVLWTWSSDPWLSLGYRGPAERLPDHRLAYLDYEGPIRGERGDVRRIDRGEYVLTHYTDDEVQARLNGAVWRGELRLTQGENDQRWLLEFVSDDSTSATRSS